jgi:hypothetical protein
MTSRVILHAVRACVLGTEPCEHGSTYRVTHNRSGQRRRQSR